MRFVAYNLELDSDSIPRSLSAQVSRTVLKLVAKGAVASEHSPKGQVSRIRLTAEGIAQLRNPELKLANSLKGLRQHYPTTRQMAVAIGKSVGTISRWENEKSLPDDFQGAIARVGLLIGEAEADQQEERCGSH